jgi:hypothetical protein
MAGKITSEQLALRAFLITMAGVAAYVAAVFLFIL